MQSALLIGLLGAAGLAYYARLAIRLPPPLRREVDFGRGDAVLAGVLAAWFCYLIASTFGEHLILNKRAILASITLYGFIVAIIIGFLVGRNRNPILLFGLHWAHWRRGILFALGSLLAAYPVIFLPLILMKIFGVQGETQDVVQFLQNSRSLEDRLLMAAMAVVVAPLAEEMIFRGYLHGVLRRFAGRWPAIAGNSLLFAAIHGHLPSLLPLFLLAVAFSLVYERTGSLWAPIVMHASFNTVTVLTALLWPDLLN